MGIIARILSFFFGPNDPATARHLSGAAKRQDPIGEFLIQWTDPGGNTIDTGILRKPLPRINVNKAKLAELKEYEAVGLPAQPEPSKKQAILGFIKSHPDGITAERVGKAFPAWRYSTITARISELYRAGIIVSVGSENISTGSVASLFAVAK
jgi:hypothetical protein